MDKFTESVQHTFLDYLAGGCELNFMVAVDFTGAYQNLFILLYHLFVFFFWNHIDVSVHGSII